MESDAEQESPSIPEPQSLVQALPTAFAQHSNGYVLAGVGSLDSRLISYAAVGGEYVFRKGVGLGTEIALLVGHNSFAAFSINGYYHIPNSSRPEAGPLSSRVVTPPPPTFYRRLIAATSAWDRTTGSIVTSACTPNFAIW